jgi:hypothetical protein
MQFNIPRFFFFLVCLAVLPGLTRAQTADSYVAPYSAGFQYGSNMGAYGNGWTDEGLAGLVQRAGGHSLRPTLPDYFVDGRYDIRKSAFLAYGGTYGMRELTCIIGGPASAHADKKVYAGAPAPSKLFANLYEDIWAPNGSVNTNNYYAAYVYKLLLTYGTMVRFWEVVNEPDYLGSGSNPASWLNRAPLPAEQANTLAPFYHYVRMLRITYEVVKKYQPEARVTTGGIGYPQYLDALLRYTDNPVDGSVTTKYPRTGGAYFDVLNFHNYPSHALHYWDNSISGFRYNRTSDYAAAQVINAKNDFVKVLGKYGYDGRLHPAKLFILTEVNVSRRTSQDRTGTDEMQRNFAPKALVLAQKNNIRQLYIYGVGESANAPAAGTSMPPGAEYALMGLYENLKRDAPGAARLTPEGQAFATTSRLLYGYQYDAARTATLALPTNIEGGAFVRNGSYRYVLWAKAATDNSEQASATYSFPASLGLNNLTRYKWTYATAHDSTTQASQNIPLTAAPSFLVPLGGCRATGTILGEQWRKVTGTTVASIPVATTPDNKAQLSQLEWIAAPGTFNYGDRLRGYVCVPQSGPYTFWLTSDDAGELWLSPDDNPAHKVLQATCTGWTSGPHDWYRSPSQQSASLSLVAGRRYYVEVLHKQSYGNGYVSVAWKLPDGTLEGPITGARLSPFEATATLARQAALPIAAALPGTATELTAYPNPAGQQTTVQFTLATAGPVTLTLYDIQGRQVRQLLAAEVPAGAPQVLTLSRAQLSSGVYLLRLTSASGVRTHKLLLE